MYFAEKTVQSYAIWSVAPKKAGVCRGFELFAGHDVLIITAGEARHYCGQTAQLPEYKIIISIKTHT